MINYYNRSQKEKKKKGKGATTTIFKGVRSGLEDAIAPALNCGGKCRQAWFLTIILVINIKVFKDIKEACHWPAVCATAAPYILTFFVGTQRWHES